jgi:hypothetical protein
MSYEISCRITHLDVVYFRTKKDAEAGRRHFLNTGWCVRVLPHPAPFPRRGERWIMQIERNEQAALLGDKR